MSGHEILIDTNIALYFLKGDTEVSEIIRNRSVVISFITELELLSFPKLNQRDEKVLQDFVSLCQVVDLNSTIKTETIALRKSTSLKLPDAIIAGTSLALELPLSCARITLAHGR
jgi:hypothetical protein